MDVLSGLALGILADGQINSREAKFLKEWIDHNFTDLPSFSVKQLLPILSQLDAGDEVPLDTLHELEAILSNLVGLDAPTDSVPQSGLSETKGLPSKLIYDENEEPVPLCGMEVVVTGNFTAFSRSEAEELLERHGALIRQAPPRQKTHYVFVGEKGSKAWRNSQLGRKIERALELRDEGHGISILSEKCLVLSLEAHTEGNFPKPSEADTSDMPLVGKTFVITGTLSEERGAFKQRIEAKGGKVTGSVSKNTDYLLAGEGGGSKRDKAESLGVEIIDEEQLAAML